MNLDSLCAAFDYPESVKHVLYEIWNEAVAQMPQGILPFMTVDFCRKYYPLTDGAPEHLERMKECSRISAEKPAAMHLAWLLYYGTFLRKKLFHFPDLPLPEKVFGNNAGMFQFMLALSCVPLIEKKLEQMNIPVSFAHDIAKWAKGTIRIYETGHRGLPGFNFCQLYWMRYYTEGKLFRIGRLEYLLHNAPAWMPAVYKNRYDGSLKVFCPDRWRFLPDGSRPLTETPDEETCITSLKIADGRLIGTPILPNGKILLDWTESIRLDEWEPVCSPWEPVPSIHIPGGGGMSPEMVRQSMLEAKQFFRKYFNMDIRMFVCCSWILNPDWERELPDSNMVKFLQEGYAFPGTETQGKEGLFFVFGSNDADPFAFPKENRLYEAFRRILKSGGILRNGGVFFLTDRLNEFGTQCYRRNLD